MSITSPTLQKEVNSCQIKTIQNLKLWFTKPQKNLWIKPHGFSQSSCPCTTYVPSFLHHSLESPVSLTTQLPIKTKTGKPNLVITYSYNSNHNQCSIINNQHRFTFANKSNASQIPAQVPVSNPWFLFAKPPSTQSLQPVYTTIQALAQYFYRTGLIIVIVWKIVRRRFNDPRMNIRVWGRAEAWFPGYDRLASGCHGNLVVAGVHAVAVAWMQGAEVLGGTTVRLGVPIRETTGNVIKSSQ